MARVSITATKIALDLHAEYSFALLNYEPVGARVVADVAKTLNYTFKGVLREFDRMNSEALAHEWKKSELGEINSYAVLCDVTFQMEELPHGRVR